MATTQAATSTYDHYRGLCELLFFVFMFTDGFVGVSADYRNNRTIDLRFLLVLVDPLLMLSLGGIILLAICLMLVRSL